MLTISKIVVDESTWLGQDIFIARGLYGLVLVSEKFKQMTESENLTNIQLVPTLSFGYDYGPT
ncbi:MAG: hypothetical protein GY796_28220 [Chloroflexi bacterium]|nr:hypothetical protein [Chloroflexota bacterium]